MRTLSRTRTTLKDQLDSYVEQVRHDLERQGITLAERPGETMPDLPHDVTELTDTQLMTLYQQMIAWAEYAGGQLALAEALERYAEETLASRRAAAIVTGTGKTATALKASAADNPLVTEAVEIANHCYTVRKLTESVAKNASGRAAYLSRDLTRRTGSPDNTRRSKWLP